MRDMEYLTEKDLPYFEKKVKKGEAVIIYIDPDALLEEANMTIQEAYQEVLDSWNRFVSTGEDSPYI